MIKQCVHLVCVLLALAAPAMAQTPRANAPSTQPPGMFPFVLPWDDAMPGTITDVSFLNAKPAGVHGYIIVRDGHFIEADSGRRIRFTGTNFAAHDAFPSHEDAEKVAARIAKLGINLVRMHHMDNSNWGQPASIWDDAFNDRQHISAAQLDKLDYLIAQFKKNGVYINLNLHVSRRFSEADGFPASVSQIPTDYDKRVDEYDRRMIALQKKYADDLLTHVNPYTHLSYAEDPAIAVVEINNENSLVGDPWATYGAGLDAMPEPFRGELVQMWNAWLIKKYGTDAKLKTAWLTGVTPVGPDLPMPDPVWSYESHGTSQASLKMDAGQAQIHVAQTDGTIWHVQCHPTGLDLHDEATYTVAFRAKADAPRAMPLAASLDQSDWHNVGLDATAALTSDWKTFRYTFMAHDTVPDHVRLSFTLGDQTGTVWLSDFHIHPGADSAGLQPGQSLTTASVAIPVSALNAEHQDWISFLADTERAYAEEMRGYLKNTLHVHASVICSQISWGGTTGLNRETTSEFADNHAYWQHPSFPHKPWDPADWSISNTPMVADLASGNGGTLRDLAENRVWGKPYTISEYNHPAPNDYRAETLPELASFAAFQDWDAIYLFDYGAYGAGARNDQINGYFGISSDPAKTAFLPAAAMIFRAGEVSGDHSGTVTLVLPSPASNLSLSLIWSRNDGGAPPDIFTRRLCVKVGRQATSRIQSSGSDTPLPSPIAIVPRKGGAGAHYLVDTPTAQGMVGYVGGQAIAVGANVFAFPAFGNNFAAMTLTSMDQKPLAHSGKMLLTLVGKVENQHMGWNATRTSVGDQWGHGPTVAEGVPVTVTIKTDGPRSVWALDGTGNRAGRIPAMFANGRLSFAVGPEDKTLWYAIEKSLVR